MSFSGCKCLLIGFGKSNRALAKWLLNNGADVLVKDNQKKERDIISQEAVKQAQAFHPSIINSNWETYLLSFFKH